MTSGLCLRLPHQWAASRFEALLARRRRGRRSCSPIATIRDEDVWFGIAGRGRAAAHGLPVHYPDDPKDPALRELDRARFAPGLPFSFYYRYLLPAEVLAIAPRGALNLHGSLLPALPRPGAGQLGAGQRRDARPA